MYFGYTGFGPGNELVKEERDYFSDSKSVYRASSDILARRILGSVLISNGNPTEVTRLPFAEDVYGGYSIAKTESSIQLLCDHLQISKDTPAVVVVGIDEVQQLDADFKTRGNVRLGQMFVRFCRSWQVECSRRHGLWLIPVVTGVALRFPECQSGTGRNVLLDGGDSESSSDAILMNQMDFLKFIEDAVGRNDGRLHQNMSFTEATIDLAAAFYWPRVRDALKWAQGETIATPQDVNVGAYREWLDRWIFDKPISALQQTLNPGYKLGGSECPIAVFILDSSDDFKVIPDLGVWKGLEFAPDLSKMRDIVVDDQLLKINATPKDNPLNYERRAFATVGLSVQVGLEVLFKTGFNNRGVAVLTKTQLARFGIANWTKNRLGYNINSKPAMLDNPLFLDGNKEGGYFPFAGNGENSVVFLDGVIGQIKVSLNEGRPVYIATGKQCACNGIFLFPTRQENKVCAIVADLKKTNPKTCADDMAHLLRATTDLKVALRAHDVALDRADVKMLMISNQNNGAAKASTSDKLKAQALRMKRMFDGDDGSIQPVDTSASEAKHVKAARKENVDNEADHFGILFLDKNNFELAPFSSLLFMAQANHESD